MAEAGRTVRVRGLPTAMEEDRLKDKLSIHFMRSRNGGGEIDSVIIDKSNSALINFEDSGVAQRVIQHRRHVLEVDGETYELIVREHHKIPDPDEIVCLLSAMVDYSQLPGGKVALRSLQKDHPDVQMEYDSHGKQCILSGAYSKVQSAMAQLLHSVGVPQSESHKDSDQPIASGSTSFQTEQKPHSLESNDPNRKLNERREERKEFPTCRLELEFSSSSRRELTRDGHDRDETGQPEGGTLQLSRQTPMLEEDLSLIMDANMFQYLQKCCGEEYQRILLQYGVEVVDMTSQGLTTLFLQVATAGEEGGQEQERIKLARSSISKLYQENETNICQDQVLKSVLSPKADLQRAMEDLSVRLPKLLLNDDDKHVYLIGSRSDVSEAKHCLLLGCEVKNKKDDVASLLRDPSFASGSSSPAVERESLMSTARPLDRRLLHSEEDERRVEGATKYKLAARFKDSGLSTLSSRPGDFSVRGLSSSSRQTFTGPSFAHDARSETPRTAGERLSRTGAQNTGEDILFKDGGSLHSFASLPSKTSFDSDLLDAPFKSTAAILSKTQPGNITLPPPPHTLKRANSFSGVPRCKAEGVDQKTQDDGAAFAARARRRSSSCSRRGSENQEIFTSEIIVSPVMWPYIKEAYRVRVEDLTSDVLIKESPSQGSADLTVIIRGADQHKVSACQQGLQKLLEVVSADFLELELHLSKLGVTDLMDETLQDCCAELRRRYKKITITVTKRSLVLHGPKQLCSQLGATLQKVFLQDANSAKAQTMVETKTARDDGTTSQVKGKSHRVDLAETELGHGKIRRDPVIKEKMGRTVAMEMEGLRISVNPSTKGNERVNGVGSASTRKDKDTAPHKNEKRTVWDESLQERQVEVQDTPKESGPGQGDCWGMCVCGEQKKLTKTKCGVAMCSSCLNSVHVHCRGCYKLTPRGIWGKIVVAKLNITVPGYKKNSALKVTYAIPDGVQGEHHPSPGSPFQGGTFEAYFPDCEKTVKLLPRLERAFSQGLTFTVIHKETGATVAWDQIPHKTALHGGRSGNGYPDSSYLQRLSQVLSSLGIEESPAKCQEKRSSE
ncbi:uncharacterized protein ACBR49_013052 [Aulostomus maculatus]